MDEIIKAALIDILQAIQEIESFFLEGSKQFHLFQNDLKTKRAVERNLEIIGEATNRILKLNSDFQLTNSRKIIDTRNRIIHSYDAISDEMIWSIVINHLPLLKSEVEKLLQEN